MIMNTYTLKKEEVQRNWFVLDATDRVLGRVATKIADKIRGKDKPTFTPHMDMGDNVIVINAEKVHLTGNKRDTKTYYWHTGYPGGIKSRVASDMLEGQFPERVIEKAAEYQISIIKHEPIKDTGLRRKYPNFISREGAKGQEFNGFSSIKVWKVQ